MARTPAQNGYAPVNGRQMYYEIHGSGAGRPVLVAKASAAITGQDYDWSKDVAAIAAPTLIVVGDADSVRPGHAVEIFGLLGGGKQDGGTGGLPSSQLAVLPGTTHLDILARTDLLLPILTSFLDAPMP